MSSLTDLRDDLARALAPAFRLTRELGGGGMSRVFLADDVALGREVVIKVLPPEMGEGVSADRFRREMQVVARLQHPHIVPILSAGTAGSLLYYVMPYVSGESLRARLMRDGALPVPEAARILREVADALACAHAQGIVHRDIKPENILLSSGHAMVTDFGVAKALGATADTSTGLTSLGMALGTPTYMAPEQAAADPLIDHRADLYALGVMGYEMLAGQAPFIAPTAQALLAAHITRAPEPLRGVRASVPAALDALILRCLEKRPADRPQQATDLLTPLDQLAVSGTSGELPPASAPRSALGVAGLYLLVASGVLGALWGLRAAVDLPNWTVATAVVLLVIGFPIVVRAARRPATAGRGPLARLGTLQGALTGGITAFTGLGVATAAFMGLRTLGIGPFATLLSAGTIAERDRILIAEFRNTTTDSLLGATLTEALTIDLSQSQVVRLLSPNEIRDALGRMQRPPGTRVTPELAGELAAREGIKVIVAGEVAPLAGGFALSAKVLDPTGNTLYATRGTANTATELISVLEKISRDVREAIGESVRSIRGTQSLEQVSTPSLEALQLYTQAARAKARGEDTDQLTLLEQAVALDSTFAMAWRAIASIHINANGSWSEAYDAAERALRHKDRLPVREGLQVEALYTQFDGNYARAIGAYQRILAGWPDDLAARNGLGLYLRVQGRYAEAEEVIRPGVDNGTAPASSYYNLITIQIPLGKFVEAEQTLAAMRSRFPTAPIRWQAGFYLAIAQNDFARAQRFTDSLLTASVSYKYWGRLMQAELAGLRGRLQEASTASRLAASHQREQGNAGGAFIEELMDAWASFQSTGDTTAARRRLDALLAGCDGCTGDIVGAAFEALGEPDSALAAYERALRPPTYGSDMKHWRQAVVPRALLQAGSLHEARGDTAKARDRYTAFLDLWEGADPVLQPYVAETRTRLSAIRSDQ